MATRPPPSASDASAEADNAARLIRQLIERIGALSPVDTAADN